MLSDTPSCVSIGLVALDCVFPSNALPFYELGGSAGNVSSILAALGWNAFPIACVGRDKGAEAIKALMARRHLPDAGLEISTGPTAIIVQDFPRADEHHRFTFSCPTTGVALGKPTRPSKNWLHSCLASRPASDWIYVDRPVEDCVATLSRQKALGARLFFEPSGFFSDGEIDSICSISDVLKISSEHLREVPNALNNRGNSVQVVTDGANGAAVRTQDEFGKYGDWKCIPATLAKQALDTSGAGDWYTATLISGLMASEYANGKSTVPIETILAECANVSAEAVCYLGALGLLSKQGWGSTLRAAAPSTFSKVPASSNEERSWHPIPLTVAPSAFN